MMFKTHVAASLFFASIFISDFLSLFVFLFASLLPDIDTKTSFLGRIVNIGWIFRHRSIMHSIWVCGLIAFGIYAVIPGLAVPFIAGYMLHLLLDALSHEGVRLFYPLGKVKGFMKVGGITENFIFLAAVAGTVVVLI